MGRMTHKNAIDIIDQAGDKAKYKEETKRLGSLAYSINADAVLLSELMGSGICSQDYQIVVMAMQGVAQELNNLHYERVRKINGWA